MLDWDDLRFFLALARHGSLLAAAKDVRAAPSTVGRRLASLEAGLGVRLLNRTPDGYVPTLAGQDVQDRVERLEAEVLSLEHTVGGRDTCTAGVVRINYAETVTANILARGLATLHQQHPDIMVDLIPARHELSLSKRESDILVRLKRPNQSDLMVDQIGSIAFGLYAGQDYLDRYGTPDFQDGCPGQYLVTQIEDIQDAAQTGWLTGLAPLARVSVQTSSHEAAVSAALQGGGLVCLARFRADREDGLTRLTVPPPAPAARIWLVVHRDNAQTPRIAAALSHITEAVRQLRDQLCPDDEGTHDEDASLK